MSLVLGLLVAIISFHVAYQRFCDPGLVIRDHQRITLRYISEVAEAIEAYRQEKHALPKTLRDAAASVPMDETGAAVDLWRRPLHYWTDGTDYRVTSYGRDGKPGGLGLDYDLSRDDLPKDAALHGSPWSSWKLPQQSTPTFGQFVTDRGEFAHTGSGRMLVLMSLLAGLVAVVLAFRTIGRSAPVRRNVGALALNLIVITAAALFIGTVIAAFHVPSGH